MRLLLASAAAIALSAAGCEQDASLRQSENRVIGTPGDVRVQLNEGNLSGIREATVFGYLTRNEAFLIIDPENSDIRLPVIDSRNEAINCLLEAVENNVRVVGELGDSFEIEHVTSVMIFYDNGEEDMPCYFLNR